jgi:hypothetical protein
VILTRYREIQRILILKSRLFYCIKKNKKYNTFIIRLVIGESIFFFRNYSSNLYMPEVVPKNNVDGTMLTIPKQVPNTLLIGSDNFLTLLASIIL